MPTIVTQGSFTSAGVGVQIPLPQSADYFVTKNLTQLATTQTTGRGFMFEWYKDLTAADNAIEWLKTNSSNATNITQVTSGGFTYVTEGPVVEAQAANAITGITAASPAVVTQTNTYNNGDIIRLYGTTGMLQIGGMEFEISSASGSAYTLLGLPAAGFAAAGTAGFTRRVSKKSAVVPQFLYVTAVSKATQAVVTFSRDPSQFYAAGMKMNFTVPSSFGMVELDQKEATVVSVNATAYQVTIDLDTSAFTTFAFPASSGSPTAALFATASPAGARTQFNTMTNVQTGYDFVKQPFQTGDFFPYMHLAAGAQSPAGSSGDVIVWQGYKFDG